MEEVRRDLSFQAVEQRRTFEQILLQIEEAIIDGRLQPGDRLPPERNLAQTFGVSRASVREALRVLEMFGVVVARRGTGADAGSIVADSAQSGLQSALRLHVGLLRIPTRDMVEVRVLLEQQAVRKAAGRAQAGLTARLHEIVDGMRAAADIDAFNGLDTEFHVELAADSGNALLPVLMEALRGTMRRAMLEGFDRLPDWRAERDHLVGEHEQIVGYIEKGDSQAAASALQDHIMRFYRHVMDPAGAPPPRAPGNQTRGGPAPASPRSPASPRKPTPQTKPARA